MMTALFFLSGFITGLFSDAIRGLIRGEPLRAADMSRKELRRAYAEAVMATDGSDEQEQFEQGLVGVANYALTAKPRRARKGRKS
jgi:hypothetical protein